MLKPLALVVAVSLVTTPAVADLAITASQQGNDVVFEGTGSLDILGLSSAGSVFGSDGFIGPSNANIVISDASIRDFDAYRVTLVGDANFGTGPSSGPDSHSGDAFGFYFTPPPIFDQMLLVPVGYNSDDPLAGSITFQNQTFVTLGITPGMYSWSYEYEIPNPPVTDIPLDFNGNHATGGSTITLHVVPEPSAFLYGGLISVLAGCGYRIKRRLA